jgi:hypothetical protein
MKQNDYKYYYHILPIDDIQPHIEDITCPCVPREEENLIIHYSFDGRENIKLN